MRSFNICIGLFQFMLIVITALFVIPASATIMLWQAVGIEQYQQAGQQMRALSFDVGNFQSETACNSAIASHNNLLIPGTITPGSSTNAKVNVDAMCHAVLPLQLPGWHVIGVRQVQRGTSSSSDPSQALPVSIGPFVDEATCKSAITAQKSLTLQNTPLTGQNVFTSLTAICHKIY